MCTNELKDIVKIVRERCNEKNEKIADTKWKDYLALLKSTIQKYGKSKVQGLRMYFDRDDDRALDQYIKNIKDKQERQDFERLAQDYRITKDMKDLYSCGEFTYEVSRLMEIDLKNILRPKNSQDFAQVIKDAPNCTVWIVSIADHNFIVYFIGKNVLIYDKFGDKSIPRTTFGKSMSFLLSSESLDKKYKIWEKLFKSNIKGVKNFHPTITPLHFRGADKRRMSQPSINEMVGKISYFQKFIN